MLPLSAIESALNDASRTLTRMHPQHAGHIAVLGSSIRQYLKEKVFTGERAALSSPAELFDQCLTLEQREDLKPHPEIAQEIINMRHGAMRVLLDTHYADELKQHPDAIQHITREKEIALLLVKYLPPLRAQLGTGRFGPATLKDLVEEHAFEQLREYVYILETDTDDWSRFAALLPTDLQARFDASDNGIEIPEKIETVEVALDLLRQLSAYKGIPLRTLVDPAHLAEYCRQFPAFAAVLHFFMRQAVKTKHESASTTDA